MVIVWVREPIGQGASDFQREVIAALEEARLSGSAYVLPDLPDMLIFVLGGASLGWKLTFRRVAPEDGNVTFEVEGSDTIVASTLEELVGVLCIRLKIYVLGRVFEVGEALGQSAEVTFSPRPSGMPLSVP